MEQNELHCVSKRMGHIPCRKIMLYSVTQVYPYSVLLIENVKKNAKEIGCKLSQLNVYSILMFILITFGNSGELGFRNAQVVQFKAHKCSRFETTVLKWITTHFCNINHV